MLGRMRVESGAALGIHCRPSSPTHLALRVDQHWVARRARHEDAVLHAEVIGGQPLHCPLADLGVFGEE